MLSAPLFYFTTLTLLWLLKVGCMTLFSTVKFVLVDTTYFVMTPILAEEICIYFQSSFICCPISFDYLPSENQLWITLSLKNHIKILVGVIQRSHSSIYVFNDNLLFILLQASHSSLMIQIDAPVSFCLHYHLLNILAGFLGVLTIIYVSFSSKPLISILI